MIYDNVELHNVPEVNVVAGCEGVRLQRVPEDVRVCLNELAQSATLNPACVEIRFVNDSPPTRVTLWAPEGITDVVVFYGGFESPERYKIGREKQTIEIALPEEMALVTPEMTGPMAFSPRVCRLMLGGAPVFLHGIEGDRLRPPRKEELPSVRYLAYGTSITHGANASGPHLCYAAQTAARLGVDLINLGSGGSAFCEREMTDYIAGRDDWDVASLALTVNMLGAGFTAEEFGERASYMVNTIAGTDTDRPVFCITLFSFFGDIEEFVEASYNATPAEYRQKLREIVAACPHPNVHLVEGQDILGGLAGLGPDLIHPGDNGMIRMGENLARIMRPYVDGLLALGEESA